MKKIIATALALIMMMSVATTAFAAENVQQDGKTITINIDGVYDGEGTTAGKVIYVTVSWENMNFTYHKKAVEGTWNPQTHTYDDAIAAYSWSGEGTITTENHSNVPVKAALTYVENAAYEHVGVDGVFGKNELTMASADEGDSLNHPERAPKDSTTFKLNGGSIDNDITGLGQVQIKISENNG